VPIQAIPFAPGQATGRLHSAPEACDSDTVLLLDFHRPVRLKGRPRGLILIDPPLLAHSVTQLLGAGIPAVIIDQDLRSRLQVGQPIAINGESGQVSQPPIANEAADIPPVPARGQPVRTLNGEPVHLRASVSSVEAAFRAVQYGAEAVGLVRSEFLIPPDRRIPDTRFYHEALGRLITAADPLPVTVRLLDLAPDKRPAWARSRQSSGALGLQGCRLYGSEPISTSFHAEVKAIDRLSREHALSILIPFVTSLEEYRRWRDEILECLSQPIATGVMVETPASALQMDYWIEHAELVSIGCNDLMQSFFAADREIAALSSLLDPHAPVLFRFLREVSRLAGNAVDRVQLCGLLPQVPGVLPVLIGLGYRCFSLGKH
jgi:phosphoenolpyruvate-protein phosphotransferase (PTS system enzyme I)